MQTYLSVHNSSVATSCLGQDEPTQDSGVLSPLGRLARASSLDSAPKGGPEQRAQGVADLSPPSSYGLCPPCPKQTTQDKLPQQSSARGSEQKLWE